MFIYPLPKSVHFLKRYHRLIEHARILNFDGYTEKHHIIPVSMGGANNKANLVILSARYHFLAHYMLFLAYRNKTMANAFRMMTLCGKYVSSNQFQRARINSICAGELNGMFGKTHTIESRRKISENRPSTRGISYENLYGTELSVKLKSDRSASFKRFREKNPNDGVRNPRYDSTEYNFINSETGELVKATKLEMNANYEIPRPPLTELTKYGKKYKMWTCSAVEYP